MCYAYSCVGSHGPLHFLRGLCESGGQSAGAVHYIIFPNFSSNISGFLLESSS